MKHINKIKILIILVFCVHSHLFQKQGKTKKGIKQRVISWKREQGQGIVISAAQSGKKITVPSCGISQNPIKARIVGGENAQSGQFPWTVLIEASGRPFCGGAILNERWIVTAAHCFRERKSREGLTIRVGTLNNDAGAVYPILKIEIHDKYNKDGMENSDIALLKTESVIEGVSDGNLKLVNGICLPPKFEEPKGKHLIVSGWGRTAENDPMSRVLKYVKLDVLDEIDCARRFKIPMDGFPNGYNIYRSQICAYTKRKDACQGDSGGPAIEYQDGKAFLVGVVSFGVGCASRDFPGVYTKVSHFMDFIENTID